MDEDNDGRFPDDSPVKVRYPRNKQEQQGDRPAWPWLPGSILEQCGPDEWHVCVEAWVKVRPARRDLAALHALRPALHQSHSLEHEHGMAATGIKTTRRAHQIRKLGQAQGGCGGRAAEA